MKKFVVVFDLDGAICSLGTFGGSKLPVSEAKKLHPECHVVTFEYEGTAYSHYFIPYFKYLITYLIDNGARIVFFSSGIEARNKYVINTLIQESFSQEIIDLWRTQGQFEIFSKPNLIKNQRGEKENRILGYGNYIKDLNIVLKKDIDETIDDAILIEDQPSYAAVGQEPCIKVIDFEFWYPEVTDDVGGMCNGEYAFAKNSTYYLLGLFKTYIESKEYNNFPVRTAFKKILAPYTDLIGERKDQKAYKEFEINMITLGFSEICKMAAPQKPIIYAVKHVHDYHGSHLAAILEAAYKEG
jgi:hypothetical protein